MTKKILTFLIILVIWIGLAILLSAEVFLGGILSDKRIQVDWAEQFFKILQLSLTWAILTPPILWLVGKFPFERSKWTVPLLIHSVAGILITPVQAVPYLLVDGLLSGADSPFSFLIRQYLGYVGRISFLGLIIYWSVLLIAHMIRLQRKLGMEKLRAAQLSQSLTAAQLQLLKSRLQPHFLFNSLNSISLFAAQQDIDATREMIDRLGRMLRLSLENITEQLTPLESELDILNCYLDIEEMRFQDRLRIIKKIDTEALRASVPNLILQPLVENAVRHGFSKRIGAGLIEIDIRKNGNRLTIKVADDGPGLPRGWELETGSGVGLKNTIERLEMLFPQSYTLKLYNREEGGATAELTIPFVEVEGTGQSG